MAFLKFLMHSLIGTLGAVIVTFPASIMWESLFRKPAPLLPLVMASGVVCGYLVNRKMDNWSACFIWLMPLAWLVKGISGARDGFSPSWAHESFPAYIWDTFFGSGCDASECLYELFFTAPFVAAIAYSIAALVAKFKPAATEDPSPARGV